MNKYYLTTAIAYANAAPHIGHALEFIQSDALARYHRLRGDDTYFLTGTDEYGVKVYETAKEQGLEVQEFVDANARKFQSLKETLNLSNDDFIRTTSERHRKGAQKLWANMAEKGDIYKDVYKGNYCVGCESFIPEKDLDEDGNCPIHKKKPKLLEEENYFFKLSAYSDKIKDLIESGKLVVLPESRKKEMLNIIGEGLKDVSFSRPKTALPWGVDVPGDASHVMYVWCDALSNYITGIDYAEENEKFKKYWPCDAHIIGKDILRFHAGIWIGMLLSAGLEVPKAVYAHGFITSEGQKMSKSLGNVVDPLEYVEKYGTDALRYFLIKEIPTTDDGDFSHKRFLEVYNSELANGLGNLLNRVLMMTEKYVDGIPKKSEGKEVKGKLEKFLSAYNDAFERFDLKLATEKCAELVDFGNKYIDEKKPWAMVKEGQDVAAVLYDLLELLRFAALMLLPVIPESAGKILSQMGLEPKEQKLESAWGGVSESSGLKREGVLFPRLEE